MDNELELFKNLLERSGKSITGPRLEIFKVLQNQPNPVRPALISKMCKKSDRASVYRNLELFSNLGITSTVLRGWQPTIELSDKFRPHHHHITCSQCHKTLDIDCGPIEAEISKIATQNGFSVENHNLEIIGKCKSCKN